MLVGLGGCVDVDVGGYHDEAVVGWGVVFLLLVVEDRRALPRSG